MSDEEWELIADLVGHYWVAGGMGRPPKVDRRRVLDAIFYVAATGCQWRALPAEYPNWNTVHRQHLAWSRDGTWERIAQRLAEAVRQHEGRDPEPSAGIVDARSVHRHRPDQGIRRRQEDLRAQDVRDRRHPRPAHRCRRGGRQYLGQHRLDRSR